MVSVIVLELFRWRLGLGHGGRATPAVVAHAYGHAGEVASCYRRETLASTRRDGGKGIVDDEREEG